MVFTVRSGQNLNIKCHGSANRYADALDFECKRKELKKALKILMRTFKWMVLKKSESEVAQSCPTLCDPMDCSLQGSSVHGILQARIPEWVTISFSRGSSWSGDRTWVSHITGRCFNLWATTDLTKKIVQGQSQAFHCGYIRFEIPTKHLNGDNDYVGRHSNLEFKTIKLIGRE